MKALVIVPVVALLALAGCGSTQYIISTKDGSLIQANSKPRLKKDAGVYTYENADGKEGTVKADDVSQILER